MASATSTIAADLAAAAIATAIATLADTSTPAQDESVMEGISGGYNGNSISLKIILAFLIGLALYNSIELIILVLYTFNRYKGVYFWSLIVAGLGIMPYSIALLIKFFELLDPNKDVGYVAIVLLVIGWYAMITGQSFVLWSRLHLVTNSRRVIKYTLYMIIVDGILLHSSTTIMVFGANANHLPEKVLNRFIYGYSVMEKVQMVVFFLQELIMSVIYVKETLHLLELSDSIKDGVENRVDVKNGRVRKTMYQLIAINAIIVSMDFVLLGVEFAKLYLIQTTLKGAVYSIKLKLEFAVLGRLVRIVRNENNSGNMIATESRTRRPCPNEVGHSQERIITDLPDWPDFVDPRSVAFDINYAESADRSPGSRMNKTREVLEGERWKKRAKVRQNSWIDEEMDKHNIG